MGGVGVGFLTTLGAGVRFFCPTPTPDVQLDYFLHHTPKLGIPVETVQFLLKLLLKQNSCCVPRFPLILTAKFHSLYVKESESGVGSEIVVRSRVGIGCFTSDSATLNCSPINFQKYTRLVVRYHNMFQSFLPPKLVATGIARPQRLFPTPAVPSPQRP